jgi:hydrogenase expression/formation protein HypE
VPAVGGLRFLLDPTRGGLATVAHEIVRATNRMMLLDEARIPVNDSVASVCELVGFDPLPPIS